MISLILPTMGTREKEVRRLFESLNNQTFNKFELIIISQDNHSFIEKALLEVNFKYKHIKTERKGLSNARNIGIQYAVGDLVTFTDDDCWYAKNSLFTVWDIFQKYNNDIVCFQHIDPSSNEFPKRYPVEIQNNISKKRILQQSSIDIFINMKKVSKKSIKFDTRFGLGALYNSGEENILLMELKKKGYKIDYYPIIISYHPNKIQKKKKSIDSITFISKGPLFKRLFGKLNGLFFYLLFYIKKFKLIESPFSSLMLGIKEYRNFKIGDYNEK
ncbi:MULTISPECIES: glycosyltransferase family 2 protein [Heyndrickxia]|uniref:glycosyltransferase family 2 protein n=1 Tax=Heyndrickxia TaxID=2837504 RepID=UPI002DBF15B9|nr:glycosyltransferase family 2 protein [Weizmannia sp. CD-2023]MEC2222766.1 glycosyltransferase family 2 protein [Weizmannia sp. CD-2023]